MNKRIFAILALVLFGAGLIVFMCSLIFRTNDFTAYGLVLCAPGAVMAFMNYMAQKRAAIEIKEEGEHYESEIE